MEVSMDDFSDIFEELSWAAFKMDGNPYIIQDMINSHYKTTADNAKDKGQGK
jgi:hypothetical protein